jgi:beta-lactamase superfamily II metal-dependent hydrolase
VIRVELLPASFGDCILVEYGRGSHVHRIVIDAGLTATYADALKPRLASIGDVVPLELLVVTHIDRDHIRGILPLLQESPAVIAPKDIWFNGRQHLEEDTLGGAEGEALAKLLQKKKLPWNAAFGGHAVVVPENGELPSHKLAGGATITLLSPYRESLQLLAKCWDDDSLGAWDEEPAEEPSTAGASTEANDDTLGKRPALRSIDIDEVRKLADTPFTEDGTAPNGSSIAFLFELDGKRILFAADAHPTPLLRSLKRLTDDRVKLDAFKLSHHGSMNNLSPDLLSGVACSRFLVSTNGSTYGHPHPETMAWIITSSHRKKTLYFNYESPYTTVWDEESTKAEFAYDVVYPDDGTEGIVIEI